MQTPKDATEEASEIRGPECPPPLPGSRGGPLPWNLRVEFPKTTSTEISNEKGKLGHLARPPASFLHCG